MRPCYYFSYYDGYGGLTKQLIEKDRGWLWWIANHLLCTVEHNKTSHISAYSYFANLWQSKGNISTMNISDSSLIGQHMVVVLIQCPQNLTLCFKTSESSFPIWLRLVKLSFRNGSIKRGTKTRGIIISEKCLRTDGFKELIKLKRIHSYLTALRSSLLAHNTPPGVQAHKLGQKYCSLFVAYQNKFRSPPMLKNIEIPQSTPFHANLQFLISKPAALFIQKP